MKKFLSLVLALVMTMSLVTVSAGAKDFADASDIDYDAAVDVISELGVVDGYSDNSFRPDNLLTRGAAAKIICNLILGPTTANALSASTAPFKDVPTTNTFAGYITYCAQQGIISGYGDGTFRPTGTLSGNAFMKMLLGALGYDSSIEHYTGSNWQVNVIKQAVGIGLDDGNDNFVGSNPVTRGEAALYAYNMLQATMVEYSNTGSVVVGDITVNTSAIRSEVANTSTRTDGNIEDDELMQFAERYFTDLEKVPGAKDVYGRPSITWELDNEEIGTYAEEADEIYTEAVEVGDIYSDLNLDEAVDTRDIDYYVDGVDTNAEYDIVRRGDDKYGAQGVTTEVYYDKDTGVVTISEINTFLGIVTDDDYTQDGDDGILVTVYGDASDTYFVKNSGYEQDTVLLVQVADDEIQEVLGEPETVEGSLSRIGSKDGTVKDVTVDSTKYPIAAQYDPTTDDDVIDGVALGDLEVNEDITYTLYLDQYGNVIAAAVLDDNSVSDLVYVYSSDVGTVMDGRRVRYGVLATVVRMDGTYEELVIGETDGSTTLSGAQAALKPITDEITAGEFGELSYDEDDDLYTLVTLDKTSNPDLSDDYTAENVGAVEFEEDDTRVTLSGKTHYLDGNTVYVFIDEDNPAASPKDIDNIDGVEVVVGGINYKSTSGKAAIGDSREVEAMAFLDTYNATSDNILYFKDGTKAGSTIAKDVYGYEGYQVGSSEKVEYAISDVSGVVGGFKKTTPLSGFYEYTENSKGYLELEHISETAFADDEDIYMLGETLDGIKNGILTWAGAADSALVSGAVVVDLTDADKSSENTYGKNVTSVTTLSRIIDNGYKVTADLFANKDNEVEAIFITKIAGNPRPEDKPELDDETQIVGLDIINDTTANLRVYTEDGSAAATMSEEQIGAWLEANGYTNVSFKGSTWSFKKGYGEYEGVTITQKQVYDTAGVTWTSNVSRATTDGEGRYMSGDKVEVVLTRTDGGTFKPSYTISSVTGLGTSATGTAKTSSDGKTVTIEFTVGSSFTGTDSWTFTMS